MMRPPSSADFRAASVTSMTVANSIAVHQPLNSIDLKQEHDVVLAIERKLLDSQAEWQDRLNKAQEKVQEATKEAKRAMLELEAEREKTARMNGELEEVKLDVETVKMTASAREKYFQKEIEEYRAKMRKKDTELGEIRESMSNDLAELGEKCRGLVHSLNEKQQLLTNVSDQLKMSRDEKNRIESQLDSEKKDRERAEKYSSELERRNEELLSREKELEAKIKGLEEDNKEFRLECDRQQKVISELDEAVMTAKRAGAELAMSQGERDRALSHLLEENGKFQALLEDQAIIATQNNERLRDYKQQLQDRESQIRDLQREIDTQRDYCRTMKFDLERAHEQREQAYLEHENLAKQLIEFRALPICQQHLPSVSSNDFNSLKLVMPFIREKLDLHDKLVHDLHQAKNDIATLQEQKKELMRTCKDKEAMINECRVSLDQAMSEIERLRGTLLEADRKQEAATMRAARLTEQLHREQSDHEKTLQLLKTTENEVGNSEIRFQKILYRMLQTLIGNKSQSKVQEQIPQGLRMGQLVPLVQKEMAALHAATARCFEKYNELEAECLSARNLAKQRENEVRQVKVELESRLQETRAQLDLERSNFAQKMELMEQRLRNETTILDSKVQDITRDRDELRNQMMRIDSSKMDMEAKLSQTLTALDYARNENRLLAVAGGVLLSAVANSLRRMSALIMGCSVLRVQVAASEVFRTQLQNLLNSLASTTGFSMERSSFTSTKPTGIFAFRKAAVAILAANRLAKFMNRDDVQFRRTLVTLPGGSCRQVSCTVGLDMISMQDQQVACDPLAFVYWLASEDFSKRFLALGSLLAIPESTSQLMPGDDRLLSALRSSLRCVLSSAVECFDPQLIPSPNRPHVGSKRDSLIYLLGNGLRQAFARHRSQARINSHDDFSASTNVNPDLPVYSFQIIFDSICSYWQKLTDQLVAGWQQQRTRLQSDLADAQRQLAIYRPDVEQLRKQLEMSCPRVELDTACAELASALDREKQLQVAVNDQAHQLQRLLDENQAFVSQHSAYTATIASKNAELASYESRINELIETNDRMQAVAADAEQLVSRSAADKRWACEYVKQVEALAVRWASKLSRLYTDQVEFRQFYGQLHGLGSTMPGSSVKGSEVVSKYGSPSSGQNVFHASQACVRLTRTFLHLFDHARKYAQSMADCQQHIDIIDLAPSASPDRIEDSLASLMNSSKAPSLMSLNKRSPTRKERLNSRAQSSSRGCKSVNSTPR